MSLEGGVVLYLTDKGGEEVFLEEEAMSNAMKA